MSKVLAKCAIGEKFGWSISTAEPDGVLIESRLSEGHYRIISIPRDVLVEWFGEESVAALESRTA